MKVHNERIGNNSLHPDLEAVLENFRRKRNFDAETYVEGKARVLNEYMSQHNLKSCVVGLSGGVDSAVVLGLCHYASQLENSPIQKIVPVMMPALESSGATNQDTALSRAQEQAKHYGLEDHLVDITPIHDVIKNAVDSTMNVSGEDWASGQLVAYARTPVLYYTTSLLSQEGIGGIICGTTNRDEGAYLGYVGKASDGMVDVQIISDLHKSEVYAIAKELNVVQSIMDVAPRGDMFDGREDTEVFGAPYDFVELYLQYKNLDANEQEEIIESLSRSGRFMFEAMAANLEKLHTYNSHKYLGKSPAVHLDLYESGVKGGWKEKRAKAMEHVNHSAFVNEAFVESELLDLFSKRKDSGPSEKTKSGLALRVQELFSDTEVSEVLESVLSKDWKAVGLDGFSKENDPETVGSYRLSWYSEELADVLWKRLQEHVPRIYLSEDNAHDYDSATWKAVGINPLFRFIKYNETGELVVHTDSPFEYNNDKRTLQSVVIYLQPAKEGGATRFVESDTPLDWDRAAYDSEVIERISGRSGEALVFAHHHSHDCEPIEAGKKIIIRTDVVYERGDLYASIQ